MQKLLLRTNAGATHTGLTMTTGSAKTAAADGRGIDDNDSPACEIRCDILTTSRSKIQYSEVVTSVIAMPLSFEMLLLNHSSNTSQL
jgi:hypothetical protein